jgi:phage terminase large subunit GpA-like protein
MWGLKHSVIYGNVRDLEFWKTELTKELQRKFKREDGATMTVNLGFIDGGWASEMLYLYLRWVSQNQVSGVHQRIKASKGEGKAGHPIIDRTYRAVGKNLKGFHIGTWDAKENINERLRMKPNEDGTFPPGYMHFNKEYDERYFEQLCSGIATIDYDVVDGKLQEVKKYLNEGKLKDEALDIEVGNLAAFRLRRWNFDAEEAKLLATIPQKEQPKPEGEENGPIRQNRSFVGVSSWRI